MAALPRASALSSQQQQHGALQRVEIDKAWFCDDRGAAIYQLRASRAGHATKTTTEKRFSDFHALHSHLVQRFGETVLAQAGIPPIPSKKWLGNRDANLIESRRHHFELFMQACVNAPELRNHEPLQTFIGVVADAVQLRVMFDHGTGTALVGAPADQHVLYTFELFVGDKKVDTFKARYSREAARYREMTTKGLLEDFVPPLEFPPANHIVDMTCDPQRVAQRGAAMQHYYQRLLTEGGEELRAKLGCSAEQLRSSLHNDPELKPARESEQEHEPKPKREPEPEPEQEQEQEQEQEPAVESHVDPAGGDVSRTAAAVNADLTGGRDTDERSLLSAKVDVVSVGVAVLAGALYVTFHCRGRPGETGAALKHPVHCFRMEVHQAAMMATVAVLLVGLVACAFARLRKHERRT